MISKKQIQLETDGLMSLKSLVEVYEEVAAGRMQRVRGAVVQSRQFLQGLLEVFKRVRQAYRKSLKDRSTVGGTMTKNGRIVAVFISANSGLYGDIVDRTFDKFAGFIDKSKSDVVVLGKLGVKMMSDRLPGVLYNYFDFSDEQVEDDSFDMVMRYLIQFEKVVVFHGQFKTILAQEPVATGVSGDVVDTDKEGREVEVTSQYLFEPSAVDIARVFEGEIISSIFEQTLHESQLAKFASRMLALDRSMENIDNRLSRVKREGQKVRHKLMNKKQLATISGIALWSNGR